MVWTAGAGGGNQLWGDIRRVSGTTGPAVHWRPQRTIRQGRVKETISFERVERQLGTASRGPPPLTTQPVTSTNCSAQQSTNQRLTAIAASWSAAPMESCTGSQIDDAHFCPG